MVGSGVLDVFWFLDVYVESLRQPINGSNVTVFNNTADTSQVVSTKTIETGFIPRQTLPGYVQTASGFTVMENYSVFANYSTASSSSDIVLNQSRSLDFLLVFSCSPPASGTWFPLPYESCVNVSFTLDGSIDIQQFSNLGFDGVNATFASGSSNGEYYINNSNYFIVNNSRVMPADTSGTHNIRWHNLAGSTITVDNSVISGVGVDDASFPPKNRGVFIRDAKVNFLRTNITVGSANNNLRGLYLYETQYANVSWNQITISSPTDDTLLGGSAGIFVGNSSYYNTLSDNVILASGTNGPSGITLRESAHNTLLRNQINSSSTNSKALFFEIGNHHYVANNIIRVTGFNTDGILASSSSSHNIFVNNTVTTTARFDDGIHIISNSINNTVENNTILTTFDDSHALYVESSSNRILIKGNLLNTTGAGDTALYVNTITNLTVIGNTLSTTGGQSTLPFGAHGIYITASGQGYFENNAVSTRGESSYALFIYFSSPLTFVNNSFNSTAADAIVIQGSAPLMYNHSFINSTVSNRTILYFVGEENTIHENISYAGQIFVVNSNNVTLRNISILNAYNLNLVFTDNSTIDNSMIENASGRAIVLDYSQNNTITDSTLNGSSADVYLRETSDAFLVNTTYSPSEVSFYSDVTPSTPPGFLERGWYLDVLVNDSESLLPLSGATVSGFDGQSTPRFSATTDSNGAITSQSLPEFRQNSTAKVYFNNYVINTTKP